MSSDMFWSSTLLAATGRMIRDLAQRAAVKRRKAAAGLSDLRCRDIPANKNIKTNKQQRQEST